MKKNIFGAITILILFSAAAPAFAEQNLSAPQQASAQQDPGQLSPAQKKIDADYVDAGYAYTDYCTDNPYPMTPTVSKRFTHDFRDALRALGTEVQAGDDAATIDPDKGTLETMYENAKTCDISVASDSWVKNGALDFDVALPAVAKGPTSAKPAQ